MKAKAVAELTGRSALILRHFTQSTEPSIAGLGKRAKKLLAEGIKKKTKVSLEKDTKILVSEVCGTNLLAEGGKNIKIKPDDQYPDWLWKMPLGREMRLEEMDPNSKEYWNKVNYLGRKQEAFLKTLQKHKTLQK